MTRNQKCSVSCGISLTLCLTAVFSGCSDDSITQPISPANPTFENIRPATVGEFWVYELKNDAFDEGEPIYDRMKVLPKIPSMEELCANLQVGNPGEIFNADRGTYRQEVVADATVDRDTMVMVNNVAVIAMEAGLSGKMGGTRAD